MAGNALPPIIGVLKSDISHFMAGMGAAKTEMAATTSVGSRAFSSLAAIGKVAFLGIAGSAVVGGIAAVKMAGDFQTSMTQLVTGAGESRSNIDLVSKGLLAMSGQVGVSAQDLASGMYLVESAGYHGAAGLTIMRTAAEGAKVGGADMATVADALTSALNAYHEPASMAVSVTNDLVATVASGKMHMQDLAGALGTVLPAAATAHVSLAEVTAAMATMTMQGTPAANAATYLRQTILMLENPSAKAQKALKEIGFSAKDVGAMLSTQGLSGTLSVLTEHLAKKFPVGSQAYIAALANMVGGTKSMQAALELTGKNMPVFEANARNIAAAANKSGGAVAGWADTQKDFNFKIEQAKAWTGALGIQIGMVLIPYIEKGVTVGQQFVGYLTKHKDVAMMLAAAIGGPLVLAIGAYAIVTLSAAVASIGLYWPVYAIIGAIALLSAGVVYAYNHWGWFRAAVVAAKTPLMDIFGFLSKDVPPIWAGFTKDVSGAWNGLKAFGTWVSNTFGPILNAMGGALKTAGSFLNAINPFAKHSPSLVENVEAGTRQIIGHYANMATAVKGSMDSLGAAPGIGAGGAGSLGVAGAGALGAGGGAGPSRVEDLLTRILDQLTNPRASSTSINVSGAGLSVAALARAITQEQSFMDKTAPAH